MGKTWIAFAASGVTLAAVVGVTVGLSAGDRTKRPKILGIAQVRILTSDTDKANKFYYGILGALAKEETEHQDCNMCERAPGLGEGPIEFEVIKGEAPRNLLSLVVLQTDDAEKLWAVLEKNKIPIGKLNKSASGVSFSLVDPENHKLLFVQGGADLSASIGMPGAYWSGRPHWPHTIHAGFVVNDRAKMDAFYRDVLGFHLYWQGGMKDDRADWVSMQVPDGTDWIEYMLNIPADADKRLLGIMNHIALGVPDIHEAAKALEAKGMKLPEQPKMGRDGKWQLNLYDPDMTRVELMEFTPVEKPCCSEYMGPHPKP